MGRGDRRSQPDHYSIRARKEGFAARSIYKLQEIQRKYAVIPTGGRVLDIGAAPGSWTQFAHSVVGPTGHVVAVDLSPLPELEDFTNVTPIVGDIFDTALIESLAARGPFHTVISDAAPPTTGNRTVDTSRSAALVEQVISLCPALLRDGGTLIAKLFQGGEEQSLLAQVRSRFSMGRLVKPRASRSESFEVFLVGTGYTSQR
ncbi:MAG: RlmE family RNA methyltransferase [Spirochaetales bacterium]|nr:RlmE family RNA methyltransferase [Spirochaetales bacterium]